MMRLLAAALAAAASAAAADSAASGAFGESQVLSLTAETLPAVIAKHEIVLVNFFEPGGKESDLLTANYARAAATLAPEGIVLGAISCPALDGKAPPSGSSALDGLLDSIAMAYEWKPVIKLFRHGAPAGEYAAGHPWNVSATLTDLVSFARKQKDSACDVVSDAEELRGFVEEDPAVAVGFYEKTTPTAAAAGAGAAAEEGDEEDEGDDGSPGRIALCRGVVLPLNRAQVVLPVAVSTSAPLMAQLGITPPAVVVFRQRNAKPRKPKAEYVPGSGPPPGEEEEEGGGGGGGGGDDVEVDLDKVERTVLSGPAALDASAIRTFLLAHHLPLTTLHEKANAHVIFGSPIKRHFLLVSTSTDPDLPTQEAALEGAAAAHRGKALFVKMLADRKDTTDAIKFLKIEADDLPAVLVYDWARMHTGNKYWLRQGARVSVKSVRRFADDYFAGKIKPEIKSTSVPRGGGRRHVADVTGANFLDVVMEEGKDVLLEMFDGSGYVKPWPPAYWRPYEALARQIGKDARLSEHVVVARIDYHGNEIDDGEAPPSAGLPRWKFYPAVDKLQPPGNKPAGDVVSMGARPLRVRSYVGPKTVAGWTRFILKYAQGGEDAKALGGGGKKDEL